MDEERRRRIEAMQRRQGEARFAFIQANEALQAEILKNPALQSGALEIRRRKDMGGSTYVYEAFSEGQRVATGRMQLQPNGMATVTNVVVIEGRTEEGIGTALYDAIEADIAPHGGVLLPSETVMTPQARAFWTKRNAGALADRDAVVGSGLVVAETAKAPPQRRKR